ncbi:MAG: hypothetical protein M3355_12060 [Actinomycetota bacterium]|nr:hypothetical protein [Actinomycetota bacterium]
MRIRLLTSIEGDDMSLEEGREYDVPDKLGKLLCSGPEQRAEPVALKPESRRETRKVAV